MSDIRDVSTLPLAQSSIARLVECGFRFVSDVVSMPVLELAEELEVTPELALSIVRCAEA
eukprot:CAMPEP_0173362570 /NCGR_PEP_ID=MMETSP1144-20121109/21879_1 /TAXON_ID=483371 /ORGANISM="non described non described, Strain CCMP2298" /LENGTH=59 /DNA_ID=CAMNT_0014312375 /DNA_START=175 /DNA_END=350 /DNA_ORIENTATION=-